MVNKLIKLLFPSHYKEFMFLKLEVPHLKNRNKNLLEDVVLLKRMFSTSQSTISKLKRKIKDNSRKERKYRKKSHKKDNFT